MEESTLIENAERIRDVIRYIKRFKNAAIVIYIDNEIMDSPLFVSHIRDIAMIHQAGLKVIIVPGARLKIDEILSKNNISWKYQNGVRITTPDAMPLIKNAAFDAANIVMTSLAGENLTAVIGNWVRARGKGVLSGVDYGTAGEIDKLDDETIKTVLNDGFIPIFPCIGWSLNGKPYNISSTLLASQIATHIHADKLFFLLANAEISRKTFVIPEEIGLSSDGSLPAMNLEELDSFLKANSEEKNQTNQNQQNSEIENQNKSTIISMLSLAKKSVLDGVTRVHILNGSLEGTLPCEIFSDFGSGTMIYSSNYGKIRAMRREDISGVLSVMRPFIKKEILLPRTEKQLEAEYNNYVVYELDGAVRACAALHIYDRNQAEIAAVAVDESCSHIGVGPKIIQYLIEKAKSINLKSVFIMTTQTADWFEKQGFVPDDISTLPEERRKLWNPKRGSKLFRLKLK